MRPLVSVIIPTFNRRRLLEEALDSVRSQTLREQEIIVVDDGSTDGTWDALAGRSELRAIHLPERRGPSFARNWGAALATAPYLAFLDSDDLFTPRKLERQVLLLEADPSLALCHTDELWLRGGRVLPQRPKHEKRGGLIFEHCLPLCRISPSATMIRRGIFEELRGFDEELEVAEDYELWLRLTCRYPVGFIAEPLTIKRGGHPDQLSLKYGQIEKFRIAALVRVLTRAPLDEGQRRAAEETLRQKCEIHAQGCAKRGRLAEAQRVLSLGARPPGALLLDDSTPDDHSPGDPSPDDPSPDDPSLDDPSLDDPSLDDRASGNRR